MAQWASFPFKEPLFTNADESILRIAPAAVENAYANAAGGFSRFPGLKRFCDLDSSGKVYLKAYRGGLVAVTDGGVIYRISEDGTAQRMRGNTLQTQHRPTFAVTDDFLLMAAGGDILRLEAEQATILQGAPRTTHVAYLDGYVIALEPNSARFTFSNPGQPTVWDVLNVMTAEGKPDDVMALAVTPRRQLLLCGDETVEEWETYANGDRPFQRRNPSGEGLGFPYTLVTESDANFGVNPLREFVEYNSSSTMELSRNVAMSLEMVDDWTDAWAASIKVRGQRFILLQAPHATVEYYGAKGLTLLLDYRTKRWSFLWGWDYQRGMPARWPGWSVENAWGRTFVGIDGGIAELDGNTYDNLGEPQRMLIRSAHVDDFGPSRIDNVRVRMKRGVGEYEGQLPQMELRMWRDNKSRTKWIRRNLGRPGDDDMTIEFGGCGNVRGTWQMEVAVTDRAPIEFVGARILVERNGW